MVLECLKAISKNSFASDSNIDEVNYEKVLSTINFIFLNVEFLEVA